MENYMGFKIEQLAQIAVESIQDEIKDMTPSDIQDMDHERLIRELVQGQVPEYYGDLAEIVSEDLDLGFESDTTTLANHSDVFTFMQLRIFEEIEQIVLSKIDGWFTSEWDEPNYPNDGFDDGQVLASAGWGTDEDYGSASDML
tara:strand:- start:51 stop:482 length:432 start_codon:yes stop_codon:yes gene_type:complete